MEKQNQLSVKDRILLANTWSGISLSQMGYKNLIFPEKPLKLQKQEKELTEKQLFSKLKKELKEVKNLIN